MKSPQTLIKTMALNYLARREYSKAELHTKLVSKGCNVADVSLVLQELIDSGLQSDERFVENYCRMRANYGYGPLRIRAELQKRGIDDDLIKKNIKAKDLCWIKKAQSLRDKKFGSKLQTSFSERIKQMRFLYYRGFDSEQIKHVFGVNNEDD